MSQFTKIKNKKMIKPSKFRGKYRIASARLQWYDYTADGTYFITICVRWTDVFRPHYFGKIVDGTMMLNELGKIAEDELLQTEAKRPYVSIPSYMIMPDHVHFILNITSMNPVETHRGASPQCDNDKYETFFINEKCRGTSLQMRPGSLWSIINHFKWSVSRYARKHNIPFKRQPNYYEHIIMDDKTLFRIMEYIENNPRNRKNDL